MKSGLNPVGAAPLGRSLKFMSKKEGEIVKLKLNRSARAYKQEVVRAIARTIDDTDDRYDGFVCEFVGEGSDEEEYFSIAPVA